MSVHNCCFLMQKKCILSIPGGPDLHPLNPSGCHGSIEPQLVQQTPTPQDTTKPYKTTKHGSKRLHQILKSVDTILITFNYIL
jgi:hypothetical protein